MPSFFKEYKSFNRYCLFYMKLSISEFCSLTASDIKF